MWGLLRLFDSGPQVTCYLGEFFSSQHPVPCVACRWPCHVRCSCPSSWLHNVLYEPAELCSRQPCPRPGCPGGPTGIPYWLPARPVARRAGRQAQARLSGADRCRVTPRDRILTGHAIVNPAAAALSYSSCVSLCCCSTAVRDSCSACQSFIKRFLSSAAAATAFACCWYTFSVSSLITCSPVIGVAIAAATRFPFSLSSASRRPPRSSVLLFHHPDRFEDGCHSKANCASSGVEPHSTGWEGSIWGIPD